MAMNFLEYLDKTNNYYAHGPGNFRIAYYKFSGSISNERVIKHTGRVSFTREPNYVCSATSR